MRIYISGKITGLPLEEAKSLFSKAEEELLKKYNNYNPEIINPFKLVPSVDNPQWEDYMKEDIGELLKCTAIYMLKNWGESKGARCEYALAKELGLTAIYQE